MWLTLLLWWKFCLQILDGLSHMALGTSYALTFWLSLKTTPLSSCPLELFGDPPWMQTAPNRISLTVASRTSQKAFLLCAHEGLPASGAKAVGLQRPVILCRTAESDLLIVRRQGAQRVMRIFERNAQSASCVHRKDRLMRRWTRRLIKWYKALSKTLNWCCIIEKN